jgi:predicted amidohydrolase
MAESDKQAAGEGAQTAAHGCFVCNVAIPFLEHLWPADASEHFRASRVEFLKGIRTLIDDRIAHLSKEEEPKGTHVTVE